MKKSTKTEKAPAPARKTTATPKIKTAAAAPVVAKPTGSRITISAKIDVGFGNSLYIRGEGAGLSWLKGLPLECVASDAWTIVLPAVEQPVAFKLVLNDEQWSVGDDFVAAPGATVTLTPTF